MKTAFRKKKLPIVVCIAALLAVAAFFFWPRAGIRGMVMLGPTCPPQPSPPGPRCDDKPYAAKLAVVSPSAQTLKIKEFSSDTDGRFFLNLEPGTYMIRSADATTTSQCMHTMFAVSKGMVTELTVTCDTGIR